jgi:hypothetical protein
MILATVVMAMVVFGSPDGRGILMPVERLVSATMAVGVVLILLNPSISCIICYYNLALFIGSLVSLFLLFCGLQFIIAIVKCNLP